jgi:hypothetical protein
VPPGASESFTQPATPTRRLSARRIDPSSGYVTAVTSAPAGVADATESALVWGEAPRSTIATGPASTQGGGAVVVGAWVPVVTVAVAVTAVVAAPTVVSVWVSVPGFDRVAVVA